MSLLPKATLYIQLRAHELSVLHVESGHEFRDVPQLAIQQQAGGKPQILAVGTPAYQCVHQPGVHLVNGFEHPRTILADFAYAEKTLLYFVRQAWPRSLFQPKPEVILHPLERLEGGLTPIEIRALCELAMTAGARRASVWTGIPLTREQLLSQHFPLELGHLFRP